MSPLVPRIPGDGEDNWNDRPTPSVCLLFVVCLLSRSVQVPHCSRAQSITDVGLIDYVLGVHQ